MMNSTASGSWPSPDAAPFQRLIEPWWSQAPDVDQSGEATLELVEQIGDVRGEVRGLAVGADEHPVLVIAKGRGAEPGRTLVLVDVAGGPQLLDGRGHLARVVELALDSYMSIRIRSRAIVRLMSS